jgi:hypothetical protein
MEVKTMISSFYFCGLNPQHFLHIESEIRLLIPQCMRNIWSHGGMDSIFPRPCREFQEYSISKHMISATWKRRLFGMHTCMLHVKRLNASENLRPLSSHPYRFSQERVLHEHKLPLDENGFVHIPQVSLGYAYRRVLQGRISHHKYHAYIIWPLHVYDEGGGHVPTVQRLCYK